MLTPKGQSELINQLRTAIAGNEEADTLLKTVEGELSERERIISQYGQPYDPDATEYKFTARPTPNFEAELNDLQSRYDTLVNRYNSRYFNKEKEREEPMPPEDKNDTSSIRVRDLFKID